MIKWTNIEEQKPIMSHNYLIAYEIPYLKNHRFVEVGYYCCTEGGWKIGGHYMSKSFVVRYYAEVPAWPEFKEKE